MRWPLDKALAAALTDISKCVKVPERQCPLNCSDHIFDVLVKYGDDGMGDVKVKKGTKGSQSDKCFKWGFCILSITYECHGEMYIIFEEDAPGSEMCCRPILFVRGEESDPSLCYVLQPIYEELNELTNRTMIIDEQQIRFKFKGSMCDEKRVRLIQGYGAAGSTYLYTLCDATRDEVRQNPCSHTINRTFGIDEASMAGKSRELGNLVPGKFSHLEGNL